MTTQRRAKVRKPIHERGMSAWLLTWEEHGPRRRRPARDRVAAILDPRTSSDTVKTIVEALHNTAQYTLSEQASFANRRKFDPYPAEYLRYGGGAFAGGITCGHNPHLYARLVDKLKIVGARGEEEVTWVERALPENVRQRLETERLERSAKAREAGDD